jgi:hypothetical protein
VGGGPDGARAHDRRLTGPGSPAIPVERGPSETGGDNPRRPPVVFAKPGKAAVKAQEDLLENVLDFWLRDATQEERTKPLLDRTP